MACAQCVGIEAQFGEKMARRELRRYREKGPASPTKDLLQALLEAGVEDASLLDIGGGVGVLQHELLDAGAARATAVDASSAYLSAAREEALRRGHEARVRHQHGDFVDVAEQVPPHDVVTLDRVLCCYPDVAALVGLSAERARRLWAATFPRPHLLNRIGIPLVNLVERVRGIPFRVFLHPPAKIDRLVAERGFARRFRTRTVFWEVLVWERVRG